MRKILIGVLSLAILIALLIISVSTIVKLGEGNVNSMTNRNDNSLPTTTDSEVVAVGSSKAIPTATPSPPTATPPISNSSAKTDLIGKPAITPHLQPSTRPDKATFSEQDVKAYYASHSVKYADDPQAVKIRGIKFTTVKLANKLMPSKLPLPDTLPICVVILEGSTYTLQQDGKTIKADAITQIFDLQTGNVLLETADPRNYSKTVGRPAIKPSLPVTDPLTPAFTVKDVEDYVKKHPEIDSDETIPVTMTKVRFLTGRDYKALTHEVNLPDNILVCLVNLRGSFNIYAPFLTKPDHYADAWQLFDAHTGNLIMEGMGTGGIK